MRFFCIIKSLRVGVFACKLSQTTESYLIHPKTNRQTKKPEESLKLYIVGDAYALQSSVWLFANCLVVITDSIGAVPSHL